MTDKRIVRLIRIGGDQVVEIPPEFEVPYSDAVIRKQGNRLIIEPAKDHDPLTDPKAS